MYDNYGSSSHVSSSSSSSSSSDNEYYDDIEKQVAFQTTANNNFYNTQHLLNERHHGGSIPGHIVTDCDQENVSRNLFNDYFAESPLFSEAMFWRRFVQRRDGAVKLRFSSLKKITAAFRMLTYGLPADSTDAYIKIGESTALESSKRFCRVVVEVFASRNIRSLDANDVGRLLHIGER
ncbi:hypothetical protein Bca101_053941 [Brassica carinata]